MRTPLVNSILLGCVFLGAGVAGLPGCGSNPAKTQAAKKKLTRDEFKKAAEGKTRAEVVALFGKPSTTQVSADGSETWRFTDFVTDPITNNAQTAILTFEKDADKASSIRFF